MYFQVKDNNQKYWTHSSLIDEDKLAEIQKLYAKIPKI